MSLFKNHLFEYMLAMPLISVVNNLLKVSPVLPYFLTLHSHWGGLSWGKLKFYWKRGCLMEGCWQRECKRRRSSRKTKIVCSELSLTCVSFCSMAFKNWGWGSELASPFISTSSTWGERLSSDQLCWCNLMSCIVQGLHILQDVQPGQQNSKCWSTVDTGDCVILLYVHVYDTCTCSHNYTFTWTATSLSLF